MPGEDGLVGDVLRQHCFPQALRTDKDHVLAAVKEVEGKDAFDGRAVERGRPFPIPVGERLETAEAGSGESALDATALFVFELGGDDVFEQDGGAPALAGGLGDVVVQLIGGAVEPEAPEVGRQRRQGCSVRGHRRTPGQGTGHRGLAVRVGRAA